MARSGGAASLTEPSPSMRSRERNALPSSGAAKTARSTTTSTPSPVPTIPSRGSGTRWPAGSSADSRGIPCRRWFEPPLRRPLLVPERQGRPPSSGQRHRTGEALDDHPQGLIRHLLGRGARLVAAPMQPGPEYGPAHRASHDLRVRRSLRRRPDPTVQDLVELVLHPRLDERPELPVLPRAGGVEAGQVVAGCQDERPDVLLSELRRRGQPPPELLPESLAYDVVEELVLVPEVGVEGGPVDRRPLGDLLHGQPRVPLLRQQLVEGSHQQLARPPDTGIQPPLGLSSQHFHPSVAYPTPTRF